MNIFWIVTDSICSYERSDLHSLLPIYKKLKKNKEGFFFKNALSQFTSTSLSIFSFLTGRFPYYIFPDYYPSIKFLPSYKYKNNINPLKRENYKIQAIMHSKEAVDVFKDILNPYYVNNMYHGDHLLDSKEVYHFLAEKINELDINENNFIYVHFRPTDPETNSYMNKIVYLLKEMGFWEKSIIIINSDHGYYDKSIYKKINLIHFNDIHQTSLLSALFIKLPPNLTSKIPRTIKKRVYLMDIMETILDYLNIKADHERESISFKELIEKDIDINKNRKIRGDCYLMFQPIKKTVIIKDNWKLFNNNGKFTLYNLNEDNLEKKDVKKKYPKICTELYQFYLDTELKAYKIFKSTLNTLYNHNNLTLLEYENILVPHQFPPQLANYLKENLKIKNKIVKPSEIGISNSIKNQSLITILFFNRLTGYRLKKLQRKYRKYTKKFIILDTALSDVSDQINNTGYMKFVIRSLITRKKQLFQRWKEILIWTLYFPLYFNKFMKKYYN